MANGTCRPSSGLLKRGLVSSPTMSTRGGKGVGVGDTGQAWWQSGQQGAGAVVGATRCSGWGEAAGLERAVSEVLDL